MVRMRRSIWLGVWLLTGCGRVGFEDLASAGDGGTPGDGGTSGDGAAAMPNVVFVTSGTTVLGTLGGLAAADAFCGAAATTAGLSGTYLAFLSTSTVAARDRLASARGWVRRDGTPVVDTVDDLVAGKAYHPILLDELGAPVRVKVGTMTNLGGIATSCGDLMSTAGTTHGGYSDATGQKLASATSNLSCGASLPLYCFGVDRVAPLPPITPLAGKRLFVSPPFSATTGIAGADAYCASTATGAGLSGTFKAVLPSSGQPAAARFDGGEGPVVRIDGVQIATTVGALFLGQLDAPPNQTVDGTYGDAEVLAGSAGSSCTSWTENSGTLVSRGTSSLAQAGFLGGAYGVFSNQTCGASAPIYCLEE